MSGTVGGEPIVVPIKLTSAFLALSMTENDYKKISRQLVEPSHINYFSGRNGDSVVIVYQLDRPITTSKQFLWLSAIKRTWLKNLIVPIGFHDDVYITERTQSTGIIYSLDELAKIFKAEFVIFPKIYYPSNKKEVYRRLVWYAMRLHSKGLLERDLMNATALKMNSKLKDKYTYKEALKKASSAYYYAKEKASPILTIKEVKERLQDGGVMRGKQKKDEHALNVQKVKDALPLHVKANGKPNVKNLASELNLHRTTIHSILAIL